MKSMAAPLNPVVPRPRRSELVATRVTPAEKAWIEALARTEGCTITALIYGMVMPVVKGRLVRSLGGTGIS